MNTASDKIRAEIAEAGVISFARFMELALYCPDYGFYEKEKDTVGRRGDFYTSVSVGPLFGQLLAFQFAEWLGTGGSIVEAGAHDGRLAKDILAWLHQHRPDVFGKLEYLIIEPSAKRQGWQRETLHEFGQHVRWLTAFPNHPQINGIIFANELLDALPVRRLGWDAQRGEWFEWGVAVECERFIWRRMPFAPAEIAEQIARLAHEMQPDLLAALPDEFTTEICTAAEDWWRTAATSLHQGKLLTFDYGLEADEFLVPHRASGTLRAYQRHQLNNDLLATPGDQDITAHVNFTAIRKAGERAGLKSEPSSSQAQFLTRIVQRVWQEGRGFGQWTHEQTRQFQTLTHPNHLGRAFRALVQST